MYGDTNIVFIVFAGLGALLVVIPFPKAIASGNMGTSMLILWTELACWLLFANAIRWNRNIENWAPAWCDFCAYFLIAVDVALVGTGVSINRRLYMIVTLDPRRQERAFNAIIDIVMCLVIPLLSVVLEYVVQQYRFYIYEDIGCIPGVGTVDLAFPLVWMLPLFLGFISAGYAGLTIRASLRQRHKVIGESGANSAWSRRLKAIGVISAIYGLVPPSIAVASMAAAYPVTSWPGWKAIHSTIDDIVYVPAQEWQSSFIVITSAELRRWTIVSLAFVVFVLLGLTADVKKMYRISFRSVTDQVSPTDQPGGTVLEQNLDDNLNDHWEAPRSSHLHLNDSCVPFEKSFAERRRDSLELTDRLGSDSDLESIQLTVLVSQPPDVRHSTPP